MDYAPPNATWAALCQAWDMQCTQEHISKRDFRPGGMAPSEWTRAVKVVRDTPVADYFMPGHTTMRCVAYHPPIAVSLFLLALSVSYS